jgi:DivIVA domain-containing protein
MDTSPAALRETRFKMAKRGYEPAEVDAFVRTVAAALEKAQNDTTAMEARARAAVARLQELSQSGATGEPAPSREITPDESETISRTLLLAQRTADATLADARAEADRVLAAARDEAAANLDAAREEAAGMIEEAKVEARRSGESERVQAESEVQSLLARRDFLESDVDHLEQFLLAQRERIAEAAASLTDIVQRVPGGLAELRKPLLSAAAEPAPADTTPSALDDVHAVPDPGEAETPAADGAFPHDPQDAAEPEPTEQLPLTDR